MAYATYTTNAIVCGSKDSNTADRSYLLFTERAGMLWATARSVREEKSKQRYALQDFSMIRVSLVRGKSGWRIGSVEAIGNPFLQARSRSERAFIQMVIKNLRRFLHGEEPTPAIYRDVQLALASVPINDYDRATDVFLLRFLHQLGYISQKPSFTAVLEEPIQDHFDSTVSPEAHKAIEQALNVSHL